MERLIVYYFERVTRKYLNEIVRSVSAFSPFILSVLLLRKVVLENSCRGDNHDLPFAVASIELTNMLCEILKVGDTRK